MIHGHWQLVWKDDWQELHRMVVPGGWLYRLSHVSSTQIFSISFVPEESR